MLLVAIIFAMIGAAIDGWTGSFIGGFIGTAVFMAYAVIKASKYKK